MNRSVQNAWITVAVLFAAAAILFAISFVGARASTPAAAPAPAAAAPPAAVAPTARPVSTASAVSKPGATGAPAAPTGAVTTPSGLQYIDNVTGTGPKPQKGQTVIVHYTGYLDNGTVFDSSRQRNQPFEFVIGTGAVIKGWDEGVATMNIGGQRRLIIPPALGYGAAGAGSGRIPPNSRLTFDVELIAIK